MDNEFSERSRIVRRIIAGFLPYTDPLGKRLRILPLDDDDLLEAEDVYADALDRCLNDGVMDEVDYMEFMMAIGEWDGEKENTLVDILPKHIEEFLVQIYQSVFKSETREKTRKYLNRAREESAALTQQRYLYYHITAAGVANYAKTKFTVERGLKKFDSRYTPDLHHAFNFFLSCQLSDEVIRELSRKSPWNDIWSSSKKVGGHLFSRSATCLTSEQQRLVLWSSMYDNIRESHECPDESIISDDDALDGWLILQRRKYNKAKLESEASKYVKNDKAGEVFVVAETEEDLKKIKELNSDYSKAIIKSRFKTMKDKGGDLKDVDFADVRQSIQMQANNQYINQRRK